MTAKKHTNRIRGELSRKVVGVILMIIIILVVNLPTVSMFGSALKPRSVAMSDTRLIAPLSEWSLDSFTYVIQRDIPTAILNSLIVALSVSLSCVLVSALAGYALARCRGRVFDGYSLMMLILQMFPTMLLLIPLFRIFTWLQLTNTPWSQILSYLAMNLPFSVWLLKGFFSTIPFEMEEAAMIDGCSQFQAFYHTVLPLSAPGITTVAIFAFINCWNEYTLACIFIRDSKKFPLTLMMQQFVQQYSTDWAGMAAAAAIGTIPTLCFLLLAQKYLINGMTAGAVKG
jgi:ABC-type glycerol-3-phosphate transport system permease component